MKPLYALMPTSILFAFAASALPACGGTAGGTGTTKSATGSGTGGSSGTSAGTSMGTGGAAPSGDPIAAFCSSTVVPFCEALFACCADPSTQGAFGGSVQACEAQLAASCPGDLVGALVQPVLDAGETALDAARLSTCTASLQAMKPGGAACVRPPIIVFQFDCLSAFKGTVAPGAHCDIADSDFSFIPCHEGRCDKGTCVPFLPLGAPCAEPNLNAGGCDYIDGAFCKTTGTTGQCAPVGKVGDAVCGGSDPTFTCYSMTCDENLKCIAPTPDSSCIGG